MYEPKDGGKLPAEDICKDDKLVVQENLMSKLNDTKLDLNELLYLTGQNIDIFNLSSDFYTDLCYNYESDIDKDVSLKDRILIYFPNITLCENGCETIGVNVTTLEAICECTFNNIIESNILSNNIIYQSQFGQIEEMISNTNIAIIKCFKYIFKYKYFISSIGGFIILGLIFSQIIFTFAYCSTSLFYIRKYIFSICNKYVIYLSNQNNNVLSNKFLSLVDNIANKNAPPKKNEIIRKQNSSNQIERRKSIKRRKGKGKTMIEKNIFPLK